MFQCIYDDFGNLCFVLPPRIQSEENSGEETQVEGIARSALDELAYQYRYDVRNRCIARKLPGTGWTHHVYDKADRLIFSQDSLQRAKREWTFTIPDVFGRTVLTGICKDTFDVENKVVKGVYSSTGLYKGYSIQVVLLRHAYDEFCRLSATSFHNGLYPTNYAYNIREWLTGISGDKFDQQLHYTAGPGAPRYNGNISGMTWQSGDEMPERGYTFTYDGLNRLMTAEYGEESDLSANRNHFNEQVTGYDKMGNILGLTRYGQTSVNGFGLLDSLSLSYAGNQLQSVKDHSASSVHGNGFEFMDGSDMDVEYEYDENGNLTKDLNKNIVDIQYNYLNLPCRVEFENGNSISYLYDANGTKLRTTHVIGNDSTVTDYCGNLIYENGVAKTLLVDGGYVSLSDRKYHFYFQDHQGNNRVIADENGNIEEVNHYYPFGGTFASTPSVQPYKYNGKELDRKGGLDWYDYGARMYDAALGRWHTVDPLSEKYYGVSPYNYCLNNPLKYIDSDGRQVIPVPVPAPLPVYYPVTSTNYRYPTTYEVKQAVNNGLNSVVDFVKSSFTLGVLTTVSTVISADHAISPEYKHQRNRERREKRELDQNQANVAKSIDTNVSGMMPNGDPAPKRDPNDGGKKTKIGLGIVGTGLGVDVALEVSNPEPEKGNVIESHTKSEIQRIESNEPTFWEKLVNFIVK